MLQVLYLNRGQWLQGMLLAALLFILTAARAQCPDNIGFESGTFQNWDCYQGLVSKTDGSVSVSLTPPTNRFTMLQNTYPQALDPYGNFPVNCPNGSNYSIKLGTNSTGGNAERVSYTFTIPSNQNNYSIIYNYAVVLQNPTHSQWQQPGFTSQVFDVDLNQYIDCGAFNFVASSNLPGFQLSSVGASVYYKPWSPITIKLVGYAGKTIRLEFTAHDCAPGGHFGYAYLDVNENCSSPVSGNTYCNGSNSVNLTAPFGFSGYQWFNADYSMVLGTSNILSISPPPPPNTLFHVVVSPYPGLGCLDTLNSTIQLSPDAFNFKVVDSLVACLNDFVDLTAPNVSAGSSDSLSFSYFLDPSELNYVPTPKQVSTAGIYYIKAVNNSGCNDILPVNVVFKPAPTLVVISPLPVCSPAIVDLTLPAVTVGSDPNLVYSYWKDANASVSLPNPQSIDSSGSYYIEASSSLGCSLVKPVNVSIASSPVLTTQNQVACGLVDLTAMGVVTSSQLNIQLSFWQDAAATIALAAPNDVEVSGTYYASASNYGGCTVMAPISVQVFPNPNFTLTQPLPITLPSTISLPSLIVSTSNTVANYTYWQDSAATIMIPNPNSIAVTGMYYVKATTSNGCIILDSTNIIVNEPPIVPPNIFSPNKDGINDTWDIPLLRFFPECTVDIYNRYGQALFHSTGYQTAWDGRFNGKILPIGTYYYLIKLKPARSALSGSISIIQ